MLSCGDRYFILLLYGSMMSLKEPFSVSSVNPDCCSCGRSFRDIDRQTNASVIGRGKLLAFKVVHAFIGTANSILISLMFIPPTFEASLAVKSSPRRARTTVPPTW